MSHITCPVCGSGEHFVGYGFAAGGLGGYTMCECGEVLERFPDEDAARSASDTSAADTASIGDAGRAEREAAPSSEQRSDPQPSPSPSGEQQP